MANPNLTARLTKPNPSITLFVIEAKVDQGLLNNFRDKLTDEDQKQQFDKVTERILFRQQQFLDLTLQNVDLLEQLEEAEKENEKLKKENEKLKKENEKLKKEKEKLKKQVEEMENENEKRKKQAEEKKAEQEYIVIEW